MLVKTLVKTLVNVYAKAMLDTPAEPLSEVDAETLGDMLAYDEVVALVKRQLAKYWATWRPRALHNTLKETLTETDTETLGDTLGDAETLAQVDTIAHTLTDSKANTFLRPRHYSTS